MKIFFTYDELKCPCCGKEAMDPEFMARLNRAREMAMVPFMIKSGYRCEKYNTEIGSKSTNHPSGKAVDIRCQTLGKRYMIVKELINAGMKGIGIDKTSIHVDIDRELGVIWLYENK